MKKQILAIFTVCIMVFSLIPTGIAFAADTDSSFTVKIHYTGRTDNNYDDWDVWTWGPDGGLDGTGTVFTAEGDDHVAEISVPTPVTRIGFIVRKPDWSEKDTDNDRFIEVPDVISGTVNVNVTSGVEEFTTENGTDVVTGVKIVSTGYDKDKTLTVKTGTKIEAALDGYFTISDIDGKNAAIEKVEAVSDTEYALTLADKFDLNNKYIITGANGVKCDVLLPSPYSTDEFEEAYTYTGNDLGATYTKAKTSFRVWAPTAESVKVNIYTNGTAGVNDKESEIELKADVKGTWIGEQTGDLNGKYYDFTVAFNDGTVNTAADPYARSAGVNGARSMIIDLDATDPAGWANDSDPNADLNFNDAVIYELHVRDLSIDDNSGITNKGKFLGLTETGTATPSGIPTGLDHMKDLGITHLHILPMYDYGSVDETGNGSQFNWGYDPVNYNVPEGSYSTDPSDGAVRVSEAKQMVQALHNNGISVVMDVVYNHVYNANEFCFNKIVPMYFSRVFDDGSVSNTSGCGNDTASERSMVRKYIVDSVKYWADEYHIDGFRFDLVGLLDTQTINEVIEEVHKDHPNVVFYGEGWSMGTEFTKDGYELTTQVNSTLVPEFAFFNDDIRDGLKGSVFDQAPGYVSGAQDLEDRLTKDFIGAAGNWNCTTPAQSVNYASCHDNNTLIDRITVSTPDATREEQVKMNNLAAAFYMTAQGIPFMQAGEEMLRTKVREDGTFDENSYNSGDEINKIRWENLGNEEVKQVYEYYKGLIAFRKAHGALRLTNAEDVANSIVPVRGLADNVLAFNISGGVNGETADKLFVIFNANKDAVDVTVPSGTWNVCIDDKQAGTETLRTVDTHTVSVPGISAMVLTQDAADGIVNNNVSNETAGTVTDNTAADNTTADNSNPPTGVAAAVPVAVLSAAIAAIVIFKKKK